MSDPVKIEIPPHFPGPSVGDVSGMSNLLTCVFCGAPAAHHYEGSSDHIFECSARDDVCGASVRFWVRLPNGVGEMTEARRRYAARVVNRENPPVQ